MKVYLASEDDVTREIIHRIIQHCGDKLQIVSNLPARGGQVKSKILEFNNLSRVHPVILLTDLDDGVCPASLIASWKIVNKNDDFIINIAVDEAEAWLMADRQSFAKYFQVAEELIPQSHQTKMNGPRNVTEMNFPIKASKYLNTEIIPYSINEKIKKQMLPSDRACKGKEYNTAVIPYIRKLWNIERAMKNSDSLRRMVQKITTLSSD